MRCALLIAAASRRFVAKDVCRVLEHRDTSKAVSRLDDDEKGTNNVRTPYGDQNMLVINESGLYSLILTSRKPEAKRFKKWVTSEVLPSIRRSGRYEAPASRRALSNDEIRLVNRKAEDWSKRDFRRYQAWLERHCQAVAERGGSVEKVLADLRVDLAALGRGEYLRPQREGMGCLIIDGRAVWFDSREFLMDGGGEALIVRFGKNGATASPEVAEVAGRSAVVSPYGDRSAILEGRGGEGGVVYPVVYVMGRVVMTTELDV